MLYSVQETCTRKVLYKKPCPTVKFLVQVDLYKTTSFLYKFLDCVSPPLKLVWIHEMLHGLMMLSCLMQNVRCFVAEERDVCEAVYETAE